jgi:DNA-binding Lrp family transcriptional regulator
VVVRLQRLLEQGAARRIGAVPNHYRLGLRGNGMTVWDIEDAEVDALGERVGALDGVSHCYRRPRRLPLWPYNLFAMVHGRDRAQVLEGAARIEAVLAGHCLGHRVLFSEAILKKTGLRFAA